jgi:hypothetical protein
MLRPFYPHLIGRANNILRGVQVIFHDDDDDDNNNNNNNNNNIQSIFKRVRESREKRLLGSYGHSSVCLSVRSHQLCSHWTYFCKILYRRLHESLWRVSKFG